MMKSIAKLKLALLLPLLWLPATVFADNAEPMLNVISFTAETEKEIARDLMQVSLYIQKESSNVQTLNKEITEALNHAVAQAKTQSAVEIRENTQTSYPNYNSKGKQNGWVARGEIMLQSKDFSALSQLVNQLNDKFAISDVSFSLSSEAMKQTEDEMVVAVIDKFKQKASVIQHAMQAKGYKVVSLHVNTPDSMGGIAYRNAMPMMAKMSLAENSGDEMQLDNGKTTLKAQVEARIQLLNN